MITRPARSRRAFTLMEVVLATLLGSLVVGVCVAIFAAIARADERSQARSTQVFELSRAHSTMSKALRLLVMDQPNVLGAMVAGAAAGKNNADAAAASAAAMSTPSGRPRIILERDRANDWQRLELVVSEPPILGSRAKAADGDPLSRYAAVRGAFELRAEDPRNPEAKNLYWVNFEPGGAEDRRINSESLIASGIRRMQWQMAKTGEDKVLRRLDEGRVASWNDLPAFVECGIETIDGQQKRWMFEVCWSVQSKPNFAGGGLAGMLGSGGENPEEVTTGGSGSEGAGSGSGNPNNPSNPSNPGQLSQQQFLELMVNTLRNIRPTGGNAALHRQMLRQYEQALRDFNDPPPQEP